MPDYDLNGLGTRNFEHMVLALGKTVIAQGLEPLGDGPDGAREAVFDFEGAMDYPSDSARWDGYLVVQSKFRQRPASTASVNGTWFMKQIKEDLDKFLDPKRKLRKPEYYLATTNIHLTGTAETGSRDKTMDLLEDYKKKLNLKGYDVWAHDNLCRFLDDNESVRKAFTHLLTPGDGLVALAESAKATLAVSTKRSPMQHLIQRFKAERENDEDFAGIIPKLQHFSSVIDGPNEIQGLESKLCEGNYDHYVGIASSTKEQFAKKLTEFQFSQSAQRILSMLLAEVHTRYHNRVWPAICEGSEQKVILKLVQEEVINPISQMVDENVLELYSDELTGMLYFLTGNCHIKWKAQ